MGLPVPVRIAAFSLLQLGARGPVVLADDHAAIEISAFAI